VDFQQKVACAVIGVVAIGGLVLWSVVGSSEQAPVASSEIQNPSRATPVSGRCTKLVDSLSSDGRIRPADVGAAGAVVLVDERWLRMSFNEQKEAAGCISNYLAGSSERWIVRIRFVNQRAGVTYGELQGEHFSIP